VKSEPVERGQNYASWEIPFLAGHIISAHHGYIKKNIGQIAVYAHKIAAVHGVTIPS
jgi:regulator of cell morphogenesis and NO signaling